MGQWQDVQAMVVPWPREPAGPWRSMMVTVPPCRLLHLSVVVLPAAKPVRSCELKALGPCADARLAKSARRGTSERRMLSVSRGRGRESAR